MRQGLTAGSVSWIVGGIMLVPLFAFWAGKHFMHLFIVCVCVCMCYLCLCVCVYILDHYCCTLCTVMSRDKLVLLCMYHSVV